MPVGAGQTRFPTSFAARQQPVVGACPWGDFPVWFSFTAPADGIYLVVSSAKKKQNIGTSLGCSNTGGTTACDLPCAVIRLYAPVCGIDHNTYGN